MRILTKYFVGALLLSVVSACDEEAIFEKELFEKNVYLISDDDNIFSLEFSLEDAMPQSTISLSCSGSLFVDRDVRITLERDTVLLKKYNFSNFGSEENKYAKEVNKTDFVMPSLSSLLKPSNTMGYVALPVYVKLDALETLSPDSIYFMPLNIKDISYYEINGTKRNALYRVFVENKYAKTKETTYYTMKGYQTKENGNTSGISGTKILHPLTRNSIRFFAGNNNFSNKLEDIEKFAIRAIVNADNSVVLSPYVTDGDVLQLEQVTPNVGDPTFVYNNVFDKQTNRFLLYYKFRVKTNGVWGEWMTIQESLRRIVDAEEN